MPETERTLEEEAAERSAELEAEGVDPTSVPLRTITGRSDFDEHNPDMSVLGEDLGDGVYAAPEPVKIYRDAKGAMVRTVPLSEVAEEEERMRAEGLLGEDPPPMVADPSTAPRPLDRQERVDVVESMAIKLLLNYQETPRGVMYNPIYDGIPWDAMGTDPRSLEQKQGSPDLKPAGAVEILEWFKRIIGTRAEFVNKSSIGQGWAPDAVDTLRIHRDAR
jgi:hypothetical protein